MYNFYAILTYSSVSAWCSCTCFYRFQHIPSYFKKIWILRCTVQVHGTFNQLCWQTRRKEKHFKNGQMTFTSQQFQLQLVWLVIIPDNSASLHWLPTSKNLCLQDFIHSLCLQDFIQDFIQESGVHAQATKILGAKPVFIHKPI